MGLLDLAFIPASVLLAVSVVACLLSIDLFWAIVSNDITFSSGVFRGIGALLLLALAYGSYVSYGVKVEFDRLTNEFYGMTAPMPQYQSMPTAPPQQYQQMGQPVYQQSMPTAPPQQYQQMGQPMPTAPPQQYQQPVYQQPQQYQQLAYQPMPTAPPQQYQQPVYQQPMPAAPPQ